MVLGAASANAVVYTFDATLNSANEISPVSASTATGLATLAYDTADNTYDFSMSVFGLSGGSVAGTAASMFHIHGAASTTENAAVRVGLDGDRVVATGNSHGACLRSSRLTRPGRGLASI